MRHFDLLYNSEKGDLKISEYGRNIQNLVAYAKGIEDRPKRNRIVLEIINLINIMNPHYRSMADYQEKLWNHLYKIADYDLDIDVPEGITIHSIDETKPVSDMEYPKFEFKNRHYGHYVQEMIRKAIAMDDPEKKRAFAQVIVSYMKLAYQTWNKDHYVNDEVIKQDLHEMTNGQLAFEDEFAIENLISTRNLNNSVNNNNNNNRKNNNNNNRKNNNNNNNNKYKSNNSNSSNNNNKKRYSKPK